MATTNKYYKKYYEKNKEAIKEFNKKKYHYNDEYRNKLWESQFRLLIKRDGIEKFIENARFRKENAELRLKFVEEWLKNNVDNKE